MAALEDDLNGWNPMEDDYKNTSFNSYNKGPGADFLKPLDKAPASYQVFVNNIPMELTEAGFGNYFRAGGLSPLAVKKCRPKLQGADTTFGFVTYATVKDCESAINQLNGHKIGKCTLRVTLARPQQEQRPSELRMTVPGYSAFSSEMGSTSRNGKENQTNVEPSLSDEPLASETQRAVKGAGRGFVASRATAYSYGADGDCHGVSGISRGLARPKNSSNSSNEKPGINGLECPSPNIRNAGVFGSAASPTSSAAAAASRQPIMQPAGRAASVISPIQGHRTPSRIAVAEKENCPSSKEVKSILPQENLCSVCLRIGNMRCSQCKLPYCSRNCQQADWPRHKSLCKVSAENEFESNFEVNISHDRLNHVMSVELSENGLSVLPDIRRPFMADALLKTQLERGQRVQAEVCYYRDPSFFWIQLVDDNGQYKKKRFDLQQLLVQCLGDTGDSNSEYRPVPGELCLARWSADKNWYRVAVKDVDSDATVLFIDYGNEEKVDFFAIRPMDESFAEYPQQAILCMLADLKPISGDSWSDKVPEVCQNNGLMLYSTIEVQCVNGAVSGKPTQIKLFLDNGKELGDTLIESLLAVRTSVPRHVVTKSLHEDLKVGEPVTVFIVVESIVSPGEFSAQVLASRHKSILGAWEEMSAVLRNAPPSVPVSSSYKYHVGDFVQARFVDGWYRARVLKVIAADQLELCYIDFGNVELRSSNDVYPLSSAYVDIPCLSCQCSLVCEAQREACRQGKWPPEYATAMAKAVSSSATYEGYVKGKDEATGRLILEVPKLAAVIDAVVQMPAAVGRAASLEGSEALSRGSRCSGEMTLHVGGQTAIKPGKTVISASSLGPNNGRVRAFVTYVCPKSAGLFYIQGITSESTEFYKMCEELITLADQAQVPSSEVTAGEAFIGYSSADQTWYRCRIVEVYQSKAEVLVYYVDFGNDEVLSLSALRRLPANYATLPAQATSCRLSGTDDLNQRTIYNLLKSLEMKKISVTVLEFDSYEQEVRLIDMYDDTGLHINLQLRMQNRSQHVSQPSESKPTTSLSSHGNGLLQAQPPPARRHTLAESLATAHPQKEVFNIFVTHIASPKHFYGQIPSEDVKKLDEVMAGFSSDAMRSMDLTSVLDDWIVGELIVAKWKDDGCWYRGVITSLELNSAGIRFVDYGNEANVPYTDIRVPSLALIGIPKQAIHMSLYKFDEGNISSTDHPAVKKQFECLTSNEILRATLVAQTDDGYVVSLTNKKGKDLSDLLAASTPMKSLRTVDSTSEIATHASENLLKDRGFLVKKITSLQEETSLLVKKLAKMQDELSILQEHLRRLDAAGVH